ncbi:uncharacterized protein LOC131427430 [Malaya genurostris]|uniref:uncharacterized protein LOC131427430 n=1 Tax=Malaya genurostris TaxID=325434 RepID=UPI0026F3ECFE|nr:uncharacterized protein LOC131427430 [Malaya genurostris]
MLWIVVAMFLGFGSVSTAVANFSLPINFCASKVNLIYVEVVKQFFQEDEYLTKIEATRTEDGVSTPMQCALDGIEKPLVLYTYENLFDSKSVKNINEVLQVNAYLSRGTYETFRQSLIPSMARVNPLAKLILTARFITRNQILSIFQLAWINYRMPNVIFVSRADNISIESCLFNPFLTPRGVVDIRNVNCSILRSLEEVAPYIENAKHFLYERAHNLHHYPLRIAIADIDLMSKAVYSDKKILRFEYLDGEIVDIMKRMMNFSTDFVILPSQLSTGFVFPNGSLGGSLDLIERHKIDLAANTRIIHNHNTKNVQYLHHLITTKLVFIVPKNFYESRSQDRVFFNTFTWWFYSINILMAIVLPLVLKITNWNSPDEHRDTYTAEIMHILAITLAVSTKLPKRFHARTILCGIMLYNLISYSIWQAIIIKRLNSKNDYADDIQGLSELLDAHLTLTIPVAYAEFIRPVTKDVMTTDSLYRKLSQGATVASNNVTGAKLIIDMLNQRSSAVLLHDIRADVVRARFYDTENLKSFVHVINENVFEFYSAMALPLDSPFLEQFNEITTRCVETGIVASQLSKISFKGKLYQIEKNRNITRDGTEGSGTKRFELRVWRNVFCYYFGLNGLALVVFLAEITVHRFSARKQNMMLRRRNLRKNKTTEYFMRPERVHGVKWVPILDTRTKPICFLP